MEYDLLETHLASPQTTDPTLLDAFMIELVDTMTAVSSSPNLGNPSATPVAETSVRVTLDEDVFTGAYARIEAIGFRTGAVLAERLVRRRPRFVDNLESMKFICKEMWPLVFRKQVDNLKTNHRGVFILTDVKFRALRRLSAGPAEATPANHEPFSEPSNPETLGSQAARLHVAFASGLIRGSLMCLGISAAVSVDVPAPPAASFQVRIVK